VPEVNCHGGHQIQINIVLGLTLTYRFNYPLHNSFRRQHREICSIIGHSQFSKEVAFIIPPAHFRNKLQRADWILESNLNFLLAPVCLFFFCYLGPRPYHYLIARFTLQPCKQRQYVPPKRYWTPFKMHTNLHEWAASLLNLFYCHSVHKLQTSHLVPTNSKYFTCKKPSISLSVLSSHTSPCNLLKAKRTFGGTCLRFQIRRVSQARNQHETSCLIHAGFLLDFLFFPNE
jgi:hypothetical protein